MRTRLIAVLFFLGPWFNIANSANCDKNICNFYPEVKILKTTSGERLKIKPPKEETLAIYTSSETFAPLSIPFEVVAINEEKEETNDIVSYELYLEHSNHHCRTKSAINDLDLSENGGISLTITSNQYKKIQSTPSNAESLFSGETPSSLLLNIGFHKKIPKLDEMQSCSGYVVLLAQKSGNEI